MVSAGDVQPAPEPPGDAVRPGSGQGGQTTIGLASATALVIGSIIGIGVFTMPAVLASAGTSSLVVLAVVAVGAVLLAALFGQLTRRVPRADGGLYAYAWHEFGDFAAYVTGWSYWISAWAGQRRDCRLVGLLCGGVVWHQPSLPVDAAGHRAVRVVGPGDREPGQDPPDGLVPERHRGAEVPAAAVRGHGRLVFVSSGNFGAFNASGGSLYRAIGLAAGIALFSFIGVETAAITARRVRDPGRDVGRASVIGTVASAILYLIVSAAVMGMVPRQALAGNGAPFVTALETSFSHGAWAGKLVAAEAVISGIGALNGWTLVTAGASRAPANDDLFPARSPGPTAKTTRGSASSSGPCCPRC
jgi:basic amino acid/polyamine antiporter, APA family